MSFRNGRQCRGVYLGEMIGGAGLALSPWSFGGAFPYYIHGRSRTTSKQLSPYGWMACYSSGRFFVLFFWGVCSKRYPNTQLSHT